VTGVTSGNFPGFTTLGNGDVFVMKLDDSGALQWTQELGTTGAESARGVALDGSGNVYVTGYTNGSFPGFSNSGANDLFAMKFDNGGVRQWTRQVGTVGDDHAYGLAVDGSGNVYVVGATTGGFPGYNDPSVFNDAFTIKLNSSGVQQWVRQLGTTADERAFGVALDSNGNICAAGSTNGSFPGSSSAGLDDVFLQKYSPSGVGL
jgi:beta-propeller repeat-containing protein